MKDFQIVRRYSYRKKAEESQDPKSEKLDIAIGGEGIEDIPPLETEEEAKKGKEKQQERD